MEVLIEKQTGNICFGKTRTMKNIKLYSNKKNLFGKIVKIKITSASVWNLKGVCQPKAGRPWDENLEGNF